MNRLGKLKISELFLVITLTWINTYLPLWTNVITLSLSDLRIQASSNASVITTSWKKKLTTSRCFSLSFQTMNCLLMNNNNGSWLTCKIS